jgi:hypothetical protein
MPATPYTYPVRVHYVENPGNAYDPQPDVPADVADKASALVEVDSANCMKCDCWVGFGLFEDPDTGAPQVRWRDAWLVVLADGQHYYLCEDDMPEVPTP